MALPPQYTRRMAFQNSNVQNSYDRMMAGNTEKSSPIQYSQPLRSLRQGGDTTTINTIGNLTPEQRIQTMASRLYEKNQAGVVAGQQIAKSAYDRMFDPRTGAAQGAAEPNYRYAMSQSNQYEPRAGSYEQEIWGKLGRNIAQNNAARAAYDTGDRSYYNKALAASNRNNLGYKNSYFGQ